MGQNADKVIKLRPKERVTVVVELWDNKQLNITGPLHTKKDLVIQMLQESIKYLNGKEKEGLIDVVGGSMFTDLSNQEGSQQVRKTL